jgi:hypothetical protein
MNVDAIFGQARPLIRLVGAVLIVAAAAKLFGMNFPISGGVSELALVGIGLVHV